MTDKKLEEILAGQPAYRLKQIYAAWFDPKIDGYKKITTLSKELREKLSTLPWLSVKLKTMQESQVDDTKKALLELSDGELVEAVLMGRQDKKENSQKEKRYTICISSQVGCSMGCKFCATGRFGFKRNLSVQEIVDQVRYWQRYLAPSGGAVSNVVLMGQGEPFLNYENVREAINIILANTEIGPSKITVSTVGVPSMLDKMLEDKNFPAVRFALSLHSAIENERGKIIPSHTPNFLTFLVDWAKRYHERFTSRALFIGLEYTMLDGINDGDKHLKALIKLASKLGRVRINLIPYNCATDPVFRSSPRDRIEFWHDKLLKTGFVSTIRHSQGQDIAAACGQLKNQMM